MDPGESSIKSLFVSAQELYDKLENSPLSSNDPAFQNDVKEAIKKLIQVNIMIEKMSLFSENEILEDVNTTDLKYILTNYYLGELYLKLMGDNRLQIVNTAKHQFNQFISSCVNLMIIMKSDKDKNINDDGIPEIQRKKDPQKIREEKIARHKKTKELQNRLEQIKTLLKKNVTPSTSAADKEEDIFDDEDLARELILVTINLCVEKTMENLGLINQELELLEFAAKARSEGRDPLPPLEPSATTHSKPFKPIVIENTREIMRQNVFKPSWSQPTMTMEQYLELEHQRGGIISGGGPEQERRMEMEKLEKEIRDSDEDHDAQTFKDREFDEHKDFTPKGSGNTYNRS